MVTDIYDVDVFTGRRGKLVMSVSTDYRFEKGDEFVVEQSGGSLPMRVVKVCVILQPDKSRREIDAIRI